MSEQVRVSREMRACICVFCVWQAGRGPQSQSLQLLAMKSSAGIAYFPLGPAAHVSAHPAMIQARKLLASLSEQVRVSKEICACMCLRL